MKKLAILTVVALIAATGVQADILAGWDTTGLAANTMSVAANTSHADMLPASDLTSGPRMAAPSWPDAVASFGESWRMGPALANSIALGSYWSVTLTPGAGKTVAYDSVNAQLAVNTGGSSVDATFHLLSSQTGFTDADALDTVNIVDAVPNYTPTIYNVSFDLSGAGLTGLSDATEFRIYVSVASGGNRLGIGHTFTGETVTDELVVNGTVIPEPATMGLFGFASAGLLWWRKRFAA